MAEANQYTFSFKEIVEALIKKQGIHEGLWGIYIEFGFSASNINTDPVGKHLVPGAVNIVQRIGIQQFPEPSNLTVDAAEVNPKVNASGRRKKE